MRVDCTRSRPNALSVGRPATTSRKCPESTPSVDHCLAVADWVYMPTRTMKQRDQRCRQRDDDGREQVLGEDRDADRDGHDDRDHQLRQVASRRTARPSRRRAWPASRSGRDARRRARPGRGARRARGGRRAAAPRCAWRPVARATPRPSPAAARPTTTAASSPDHRGTRRRTTRRRGTPGARRSPMQNACTTTRIAVAEATTIDPISRVRTPCAYLSRRGSSGRATASA